MRTNQIKALLLVNRVRVRQTQLLIQIAHRLYRLRFISAVIRLENTPLRRCRPLQRHHHQPGALALAYIRALFARHLGIAEAVQKVILREREKDTRVGADKNF